MLITSKDNETIKHIRKLKEKKYRDEYGEYIIEGIKLINEAIEESIYTSFRSSGILEQMMTGEAPAYQTLTPEIVESAVERIFAERPVIGEERPDMGTVTIGIDPAVEADTQELRDGISSSDEEAPF